MFSSRIYTVLWLVFSCFFSCHKGRKFWHQDGIVWDYSVFLHRTVKVWRKQLTSCSMFALKMNYCQPLGYLSMAYSIPGREAKFHPAKVKWTDNWSVKSHELMWIQSVYNDQGGRLACNCSIVMLNGALSPENSPEISGVILFLKFFLREHCLWRKNTNFWVSNEKNR